MQLQTARVGARFVPDVSTLDQIAPEDFTRLASLVTRQTGIKLPPAKRLMIEGRLRKRMRAVNKPNLTAYCRFLFDEGGLDSEITHLIDVVTTNKTDFFREPEHLHFMENHMVDALLAQPRRRPLLKVWSAASSNGAEAWSIAMVLEDVLRRRRDFSYAILGTDISTIVLAQARRAIYPAEVMDPVPRDKRQRYVMDSRTPELRGEVRIVPELRRCARFDRMNLMDTNYPYDRDVDIIFLRNVLIYFEKADQEAVVSRLVGHLRPGGYLVVGHSESMVVVEANVRQVGPTIFQKS
ncbi:protein-glutamate O-methyltransferase CheR [Aurantimonas sp. VKM B-3413]|uniref:CheR family methyltransferase n=1 Tax=Aurantimonas sp. VKM B-3413 TaxID=2779401 RepID=UPI001E2DF10B|nr:CheR family methyltransferase [Aurantimonas sp. VKM B-3413]MCB8836451.1 chemotaxis protein CheR [Aurantimonas sp. VKM B-3413]